MAVINFATREITSKIVYFGADGSDCEHNLEQLHSLLDAVETSRMHRFGVEGQASSLCFQVTHDDPSGFAGFRSRYRLYTLTTAATADVHQRVVLDRVDGVVFVADARPERDSANLDAILLLDRSLKKMGVEMASLPMVLQVSRTADRDARTPRRVVFDLNPYGFPVTDARDDAGLRETHRTICEAVVERLRDTFHQGNAAFRVDAVFREPSDRMDDVVREHVDAMVQAGHVASTSLEGLIERDEAFYRSLPLASTLQASFHFGDLDATRAIHLLEAHLVAGRISLDVVLDRDRGGAPRRVSLVLDPQQPVSEDEPSIVERAEPPPVPEPLPPPPDAPAEELPGVVIGLVGVVGGVAAGLFLGYLFL